MRMTSLTLCGLLACSALALGQEPGPRRYYPLNTPLPPPGRAGAWAGSLGKAFPFKFQQVEIQLPGEGQVTWYEGSLNRAALMPAPAMAGLLVGPVYRLMLSDMPDFPGVQLYPSIEMVDRLHPPVGRETQFPVIVPFTVEEIQAAIAGRLVTKVIYLEQPNRASPVTAERGRAIPAIRVDPNENVLEVADVHGRPLAIVRLGGRVPDTNRPEPGFFGTGAPVQFSSGQDPTNDAIIVPAPGQAAPQSRKRRILLDPPREEQEDSPTTEEPQSDAVPQFNSAPAKSTGSDPSLDQESEVDAIENTAEVNEDPAFEPTPAVRPEAKASDFE
jgi:hypothetical protein